jgi:hypothetical protein
MWFPADLATATTVLDPRSEPDRPDPAARVARSSEHAAQTAPSRVVLHYRENTGGQKTAGATGRDSYYVCWAGRARPSALRSGLAATLKSSARKGGR